jgi:hypothetical protein
MFLCTKLHFWKKLSLLSFYISVHQFQYASKPETNTPNVPRVQKYLRTTDKRHSWGCTTLQSRPDSLLYWPILYIPLFFIIFRYFRVLNFKCLPTHLSFYIPILFALWNPCVKKTTSSKNVRMKRILWFRDWKQLIDSIRLVSKLLRELLEVRIGTLDPERFVIKMLR